MTTPDDERTDPETTPDAGSLDEALDRAFDLVDEDPSALPSVIERIGELTGKKPEVTLREPDDTEGTPLIKPGTQDIGKYIVHGELGRGGVGSVHQGQDKDLGRQVAMKFLHDRYVGQEAVLHRFVEEAQIGGQLQHPGIVPVYDLGMIDGKPFFSMKLVKGQTLAKKLAERESPASDQRSFLAIFEAICQTMAYAHTRGVVHRDLKPANIMIGSFGEVQVVDWGMGKVMQRGGVADEKLAADRHAEQSVIETVRTKDDSAQSIMGSVMGTPAYMPPEQARGDVEAMDERSDVFALGAILCEILTGLPPYVGEPAELIGMAAMAKLEGALERLDSTGAEPALVDLAKRCLMPAPSARPRSAEVVAKAIHAHLSEVEERVHTARVEAAEAKVRAQALKRTQRLGVALILVFATGLAASLIFWRAAEDAAESERVAREEAVESAENERIAREAADASAQAADMSARDAVTQKELAERELARATEIKQLISEMLLGVSPAQARGADTKLLEEIIATTSDRLKDGAIEDELVAAELHLLTGALYRSISKYDRADDHLPIAVALREEKLGPHHPATLKAREQLTALRRFQGEHQEAERLARETYEGFLAVHGPDHEDTLVTRRHLAFYLQSRAEYAEAETMQNDILARMRRTLGDEHRLTLAVMLDLANLYNLQGRYVECEALTAELVEAKRRTLGDDHPDTISSMGNLALVLQRLGRLTEAEQLELDVLERSKRVFGEEHDSTLGSMTNLAGTYTLLERYDEAEILLLQVLEIGRRTRGEKHPENLTALSILAIAYMNGGKHAEAEALYLELIEIRTSLHGPGHPYVLGQHTNLGLLYLALERFDDAAKQFETSLPIKRRVLGTQHPWTMTAIEGLMEARLGQGRIDDARELQQELIALASPAAEAEGATAAQLAELARLLLVDGLEEREGLERARELAERACDLAEGEELESCRELVVEAEGKLGELDEED